MQAVYVDLHRAGLEQREIDALRAQQRLKRGGLGGLQQLDLRHQHPHVVVQRADGGTPAEEADVEQRKRGEQPLARRVLEVLAAGRRTRRSAANSQPIDAPAMPPPTTTTS
jgi:hypothetical protein